MITRQAVNKKRQEESSGEEYPTSEAAEKELAEVFGTDTSSDNTSVTTYPTISSREASLSRSCTSTSSSLSRTTLMSYQGRMEEAAASLAPSVRRKMERLLGKTQRMRDKLSRQKDSDNPATSDMDILKETQVNLEQQKKEYKSLSQELFDIESNPTALEEDDEKAELFDDAMQAARKTCKYLISQRSVYSNISSVELLIRSLINAYEGSPENDHSVATTLVRTKLKDLQEDLHLSSKASEEEWRDKGNQVVERALATLGRVAGAKPTDIKPPLTATKTNVKLKHIEIPNFSGKTEDWLPFKRLFFKAVHHNESLDDDTKLTYLVQAMQDQRIKAEYAERLDEPGAYSKIMSELESEHDKPRWMHRRYCDRMTNLQPNPHTREGIRQFISEITTILNGLIRLKGEDARVILTSVAEGVMDPELRALWNQRTDSKKTTPQISELLQFMKDQADHMEDEPSTGPTKGWERVKHRQNPKHKGAAHSAVSAAPTQQRGSQPKQNHHPQGGTPSTSQYSTAYACPVCQGGHPLFHCPTFKGYTVTQRREKVMACYETVYWI